ncbi:MAG: tetratricopeptide repeat protein [Pseudomonadota bacterium]
MRITSVCQTPNTATPRHWLNGLLLAVALLSAGCQTTPAPELDYGDVLAKVNEQPDPRSVTRLRSAFLATDEFPDQLTRLTELENQALQLVEDEPLKLGSLGSAILDLYYGSLAGHYVSMKFYEFVENPTARARHAEWLDAIRASIEASGDGSISRPYPAVTPVEPTAYARSGDSVPVGSIYRSSDADDFILLLQTREDDSSPLRSLHFDLNGLYRAIANELQQPARDAGQTPEPLSPFALMAYLARQGDTAAQASIGAYLATHDRQADAIDWLEAASRSGNVLANNLLARVYFEQAEAAEDDSARDAAMEQVLDNYVHAIALGSLDSAYALGVLYLSEKYGAENVTSGLPLLRQAEAGGHPGASLFLGHLHYQGREVEQDFQNAASYYVKASAANNAAARVAYARFLLDRTHTVEFDPRVLAWLEELADRDSPEAMVLIGNLHGRGVATRQSPRRALQWFERALEEAAGDANIINEVAWVLSVTDQPGLKRPQLALKLMDELMASNEAAATTPAFLDTWAAALAANGNFEQAIKVQEQALERARPLLDAALIEELEGHLEAFKAGRQLTEPAP